MHPELVTPNSSLSTQSDEVLVRVEGVSKKFCRSLKKSLWYGVCDIAGELNPFAKHGARGMDHRGGSAEGGSISPATSYLPLATHAAIAEARDKDLRDGEFYAVRDVSFELRRGECLGLIGHNGAGKTTLLKILNGLIKPDRGRIEMNGRVGALIALGAGFNPILTGRENIYINGSVLGLSKKEIDEKIDEIIEFAEIGDFIDMPVQNYSSGMSVRLGFSIASSLSPDVLILDEVLAVGDISFVIKCLNRVRNLSARAAVILVSHNMQSVSSFCTRVILMDHGCVMIDAPNSSEAIDRYFEMVPHTTHETGSREAVIESILLEGGGRISHGSTGRLELKFSISSSVEAALITIYIADETMMPLVCMPVNNEHGDLLRCKPGTHKLFISLGSIDVVPGKYSLIVSFIEESSKRILLRSQGLTEFRVFSEKVHSGKIMRPATARMESR